MSGERRANTVRQKGGQIVLAFQLMGFHGQWHPRFMQLKTWLIAHAIQRHLICFRSVLSISALNWPTKKHEFDQLNANLLKSMPN